MRKIIGREMFELYIDGIDIEILHFHPNKWQLCLQYIYNATWNWVYNFLARQKQHFSQAKTQRREKASVKHNHKGYQ